MSALILKIIACVSMLIDHVGCLYGITIFRMIGRLSFPIYLFLIYNGYRHTSNPLHYALRLAAFAGLSQIPFALCFHNTLWYSTGNVMFTLLAALLCLWAADRMRKHKWLKWICFVPFLAVFYVYYRHIVWTEYADKAILMMSVLFLFGSGKGFRKVLLGVGLAVAMNYTHLMAIAKNILGCNGQILPVLSKWDIIQLLSMLSIPLILLYNGKKGTLKGSKQAIRWQQYSFYLFYPVHLLILWLITLL